MKTIKQFERKYTKLVRIRPGPPEAVDHLVYLRVDDQDTTDSEKALIYLHERGIREAVLLGAVGWRLDFA